MILRMARVRILGPREHLHATLAALQDLGVMHLASRPETPGVRGVTLTAEQEQEHARLTRTRVDLEAALALWAPHVSRLPAPVVVVAEALEGWEDRARELRAELQGLADEARALAEERAMLERFTELVRGFEPLLAGVGGGPSVRAYYLVLAGSSRQPVVELRRSVARAVGEGAEVVARPLSGGGVGVALLVPASAAGSVDALLEAASLDELKAPEAYGGGGLTAALPRMGERSAAIPAEQVRVGERARALASASAAGVQGAVAAVSDRLAALDAAQRAAWTDRAFVLEGWVPEPEVDGLTGAPPAGAVKATISVWSAVGTTNSSAIVGAATTRGEVKKRTPGRPSTQIATASSSVQAQVDRRPSTKSRASGSTGGPSSTATRRQSSPSAMARPGSTAAPGGSVSTAPPRSASDQAETSSSTRRSSDTWSVATSSTTAYFAASAPPAENHAASTSASSSRRS